MLPFQKTKENIVHFPGSRFVSCDQLDNKFHILLMFFLFFHMYPSVPRFIERLFVFNIHQTYVLCKDIEYVILCSSPLCNYNTHFFDTFRHSGGNRPEFWTLFYLYGESYKSEIRTLSTAANFSMLSMVGE